MAQRANLGLTRAGLCDIIGISPQRGYSVVTMRASMSIMVSPNAFINLLNANFSILSPPLWAFVNFWILHMPVLVKRVWKKVRVLFCKSAHGTAQVTAVPTGDKCYFSFPRRFFLLVFLSMHNIIRRSNNSSLPVGTVGNPSDALRSGCGKPVGRTVGRLWESPLLTRKAKAIK